MGSADALDPEHELDDILRENSDFFVNEFAALLEGETIEGCTETVNDGVTEVVDDGLECELVDGDAVDMVSESCCSLNCCCRVCQINDEIESTGCSTGTSVSS